jgi:hypothetical protein
MLDALLAGVAEKICDDAGLPGPTWARAVPALPEPWSNPGTPAMQQAIAAATPRALAKRGLSIDEASLWREPAALGV